MSSDMDDFVANAKAFMNCSLDAEADAMGFLEQGELLTPDLINHMGEATREQHLREYHEAQNELQTLWAHYLTEIKKGVTEDLAAELKARFADVLSDVLAAAIAQQVKSAETQAD